MLCRVMKRQESTVVKNILKACFSHGDYTLTLDDGGVWVVAEEDDKIVGACSLVIQQRYTYLSDLCTLPEYRNRGLAKGLVQYAMKLAYHNTKEMWMMCHNPYSIKIATSLGFKKENEVFIKNLHE